MSIDIDLAQRIEQAPANDPRWLDSVRASRVEGDAPLAVGSVVVRELHVPGHELTLRSEVTRLEPGHLLELRTIDEMGPLTMTHAFETLDDGSTLARLAVNGAAGTGIAGFVLRRALERGVASSLRRLSDAMRR